MWILVIVVGTLVFLWNSVYSDQKACEAAKASLEKSVSAGECAPYAALKGSHGPSEDEDGRPEGPPGPHDDSDG